MSTQISDLTISLKPTTVKTANYTAAANELVKTNPTSADVIVTVPAGLADKTRICIKQVAFTGAFKTTFALSGSEVLNIAGGATSGSLTLVNQAVTIQLESSTGIWSVISSDLPLSQLDLRYNGGTSNFSDLPVISTKNLFNQYNGLKDFAVFTNGTLTGATNAITAGDTPVLPSTQYTLSGMASTSRNITFKDASKVVISTTTQSVFPYTFTTPALTAYIDFTAKNAAESSLGNVQLELGSSVTTYEVYSAPIVIIASGSSITNGFGAISWTGIVTAHLSYAVRKGVTVINGGVNSQDSSNMLTNLPALISSNPTAKYVVLEGNINDAKGKQLPISEANYRSMITLVKNAGMIPLLTTSTPIDPAVATTMGMAWREQLNYLIRQLGKKLNIPVIDNDIVFGQNYDLLQADKLHPTTAGQYLFASNVAKTFIQYTSLG